MRGDLSAPVLAIIVTIGIIAAGLVLLAWFWWFAPQAGKAGSLQIIGTPAIINGTDTKTTYISVKNIGNVNITISGVEVKGAPCGDTDTFPISLGPGDSANIEVTCSITIGPTEYTVDGVIKTDHGIYVVNLAVIRQR
jgi:hypothetical protein